MRFPSKQTDKAILTLLRIFSRHCCAKAILSYLNSKCLVVVSKLQLVRDTSRKGQDFNSLDYHRITES